MHDVPCHIKKRVEDFTDSERGNLYDNVMEIANALKVPVDAIYVIGSYCFNVPSPNDIDIVILIPESFRRIWFGSEEGFGYDYVNRLAEYDKLLSRYLHIKASMKITNTNRWLAVNTDNPKYNLVTGEITGKDPYEVFPYTLTWNENTQTYIKRPRK